MKEDVVDGGGGGGGFELRLSSCPVAQWDAVGVVSFALADVSLGSPGFEALVFNSIPVAAAPGNSLTCLNLYFSKRGHMVWCPRKVRPKDT